MSKPPSPRPALKRAPDADLHPALILPPAAVVSVKHADKSGKRLDSSGKSPGKSAGKSAGKSGGGRAGKPGRASKGAKQGKDASGAGRARAPKAGKPKKRKGSALGAGGNTADSVISRPRSAKTVALGVDVPKPLRKEIRRRAAEAGVSPDEFVTDVLAAWLGDGRWW